MMHHGHAHVAEDAIRKRPIEERADRLPAVQLRVLLVEVVLTTIPGHLKLGPAPEHTRLNNLLEPTAHTRAAGGAAGGPISRHVQPECPTCLRSEGLNTHRKPERQGAVACHDVYAGPRRKKSMQSGNMDSAKGDGREERRGRGREMSSAIVRLRLELGCG